MLDELITQNQPLLNYILIGSASMFLFIGMFYRSKQLEKLNRRLSE